ncbi:hypothetical protein EV702DRAFT_1181328 [Suillus placidus]|uniref:GMP synthase (glutamine-hydrolyzing) n=1 Tax=Suillus placidus TaxID=48579 RepID=A0A9P6ZMD5_9AGAM|nr:hypothetical protein EV702DRAFT_1181328 [Suillus placidus]
MAEIHDQFDTILILDFGLQYSHLITRRYRELNVYEELMPSTSKLADLKFKHNGIILSGPPYSVYDDDAPHADPGIYTLSISVNANSRGIQEICWNHKGQVAKCDHGDYGLAEVQISRFSESENSVDALFEGLGDRMQVRVFVLSVLDNGEVITVLRLSCSLRLQEEFIGKEIVRIRAICGPKGRVIGAVSGSIDSTVAAKLMHEAIAQQVNDMLNKDMGVDLTVADASELFISRLDGIEDLEQKRKVIGNTFINIEWLLQGTLYPDVIESISFKGPNEVCALGRLLSIPAPLVQRHSFPGPGLAIRILGPVARERVKILQQADHIYIEEVSKANLYNLISQATAILLPVKAVGVMGDKRTYELVIALRAVTSEDFMAADW